MPGHRRLTLTTRATRIAFISSICIVAAANVAASPLKFAFTPVGTLAGLESSAPEVYREVTGGFTAAGALLSSRFVDDMTINVAIDFTALPPGVLGADAPNGVGVAYADIKALLDFAQTSVDDATAVASLPSGDSLSFLTNDTTTGALRIDDNDTINNRVLGVQRANFKAFGYAIPGIIDPNDTVIDAAITISNLEPWDFNRSDGVDSDKYDFVSLAMHEIGHAMGFLSGVDIVDRCSAPFGPAAGLSLEDHYIFTVLDLFRHGARNGGGLDFATGGDGVDNPYFSIDGGATSLGLFSTGFYNGDFQAGHWKVDLGLGIMNPNLGTGELINVSNLDLRAFDVIGYDLASVPEIDAAGTGSVLAFGLSVLGLLERRRRLGSS